MDRELVLGAAMFFLLLVVAGSIALIAWSQPEPPDKDALLPEPGEPPVDP